MAHKGSQGFFDIFSASLQGIVPAIQIKKIFKTSHLRGQKFSVAIFIDSSG